jgi:hypothetical protein
MKQGMNAPHESINASVVQQKDWRKGGRRSFLPPSLPPSLLQMKINPQDMLAGEERRAFWDILRDHNVFVFCLKKQLHFCFSCFYFWAKAFSF